MKKKKKRKKEIQCYFTKRKITCYQQRESEYISPIFYPYFKEAANYLLICLLNHVDTQPTPLGPGRVSTLVNEKEYLEAKGLPASHVTCFAYDHTLVSVIRHPRESGRIFILGN